MSPYEIAVYAMSVLQRSVTISGGQTNPKDTGLSF